MNFYSVIFVPVRPRDEKKIEAIFKATLALVKEKGLAGITMSDISKEASIATGTLYIYFKNKEELIKELFWECRQHSAKQYFIGVDNAAAFEERMWQIFQNIIHYKMLYFEVSAFLEQTYHSPYVCMTDLKKKEKALEPLFQALKDGIKLNQIKNIEPELLISCMFGIINEIVRKTYFSNKKLSAETIRQVYSIFWDGIRLT